MGIGRLKVASDHIEGLANPKNPILGLEELVWNGLDADAAQVEVVFDENDLGTVHQIRVIDNGNGIPFEMCETVFGSLGGSEKRYSQRTPSGRKIHGKQGKGRFRAFGVGRHIQWISTYKSPQGTRRYSISASRDLLSEFHFSDPAPAPNATTGVEVIISTLFGKSHDLDIECWRLELGRRLALYLAAYQNIRVIYAGKQIDVEALKLRTDRFTLTVPLVGQKAEHATMTVVEWKTSGVKSMIYLCDDEGIAVHEAETGQRDNPFSFTAYVSSPTITELAKGDWSFFTEMDEKIKPVLKAVRDKLNVHFRRREAERSTDLVKQWRRDRIYPYKNRDAGPIEKAEREVFDICALKIHEYLPGFQKLEPKSQGLTFNLVKEALKTSPSSLRTILEAALGLPADQQEELATLLEWTSLTAMINASKVVMDRLAFLESINQLLYGTFKKELLERKQFQRILVGELWIFGEQYLLGVDDQSLKTLLEQHIKILGREALSGTEAEVFDLDGRKRILDLMLYRGFPETTPDWHEHLVVELKAPTCVLGEKEITQIKKYAYTVIDDERFNKHNTRWTFLLIGNKLDKYAKMEVGGNPQGLIKTGTDDKFKICVLEWSYVLQSVRWRYEFFRSRLEYQASNSDGMKYLERKHSEYLPDLAAGTAAADNDDSGAEPPPAVTVNGAKSAAAVAAKAKTASKAS
jgi:hypothetical protein